MASKKNNKAFTLWVAISFGLVIFGFLVVKRTFKLPCANTLSCEESLNYEVNNDELAIFNGLEIKPPTIDPTGDLVKNKVLGDTSSSEEKHIYVDLTTQTLKAYDGQDLYLETKVSTGKWYPTPTGDFKIWHVVRATKMSGGEGADYYYLPNVPYVMFFSNSQVAAGRGFSIHGAYWHNNFGHAMSHGCVNMRTIDAKKIYDWIGSQDNAKNVVISIYGKAT